MLEVPLRQTLTTLVQSNRFTCWLQKGYYHRNANFQTYVDVPHKDFVSGEHTTTDPPHLRMVFNGAIVNSLLQPAAPLPAKSCQAAQGEAVTHLPKQPAIGNSAQQAESSSAQTPAEPSAEHSASALQATGSSAQQADGSSAQTQPAGPSLVQAACSLGQQANGISAQTPVERPSAKQGASALKAADALVQLAGKPHGRVGTGPTNHPQCAAHMGQCQTAQCTPAACTASLMTTAGQQPSVNTAEKHPQQVNDQYRLQLAEHQEDSSRAPSCADQSADSSCCSSGLESRLQPGSGLLDVDGCQPTGEQGTEWNSMFRHSMKLAKNIKWTHKGLQVTHCCTGQPLVLHVLVSEWLVACVDETCC